MLNPERRVQEGDVSLQTGDNCIRGSYPLEPARHAGIDPENPGSVSWYYVRSQQLLVIDLGGQFEDNDEHDLN